MYAAPHIYFMATIFSLKKIFKRKNRGMPATSLPLFMANSIASPSIAHTLYSHNCRPVFHQNYCQKAFHQNYCQKASKIRCNAKTPSENSSVDTEESKPENTFLKIAWYGSEFLGIAASLLRSPPKNGDSVTAAVDVELPFDGLGKIDRAAVVDAIKQDFEKSYFVTGNVSIDAYEEKCEFADPAGSFKGVNRFKRNCTNFGYLLETSNMKLMKWEDFEDKGIGHWRFRCVMSFPWKPILSATGYTEYYFDEKSGKICRHVEHWNVPKMALFKQILRPSRAKKST